MNACYEAMSSAISCMRKVDSLDDSDWRRVLDESNKSR